VAGPPTLGHKRQGHQGPPGTAARLPSEGGRAGHQDGHRVRLGPPRHGRATAAGARPARPRAATTTTRDTSRQAARPPGERPPGATRGYQGLPGATRGYQGLPGAQGHEQQGRATTATRGRATPRGGSRAVSERRHQGTAVGPPTLATMVGHEQQGHQGATGGRATRAARPPRHGTRATRATRDSGTRGTRATSGRASHQGHRR
jgi:hypothetical protein